MRAHEAGWAHADGAFSGPPWLRAPEDVGALVPRLWSRTARKREDGVLEVGGVALTDLAAEHGTAAYVLDEEDFRHRARAFRDAFAGWDVCYAGKAFLCGEVVRWLAEDGLHLDVCSAGELELALRGGFDPARLTLHGNNKSAGLLAHAVARGVGRVVVDSFDEIERIAALARTGAPPVRVMVRVTAGVEAHTHEYIATSHEDQKFGFSLAAGDAFEGVRRLLAVATDTDGGVEVLGLHSHIGSQIFDTAGFEVAARRVLGLAARVRAELGVELPELDLGGGFGIAYTTQDDPADPVRLAGSMDRIVAEECERSGLAVPRLSIEPGRAIAGPATCTVYSVGTVKRVALDGGAARTYVSVDGGMSDNVRTALYDADYSCTLASRASEAAPVLSRVVGSHCEAGDIVVKDEFLPGDLAPGDLVAVPATGAYCRSLSSNYNHALRPPVIAVADGRSRVLLRRETYADLFATDVSLGDGGAAAGTAGRDGARMGGDEHV
ncbi:diaminopimelate decarboxylase [Nocardioidaceae bacterium]|nr:diaminopimelate decarboxylase [Nocardioidaceae bacterium]